ncbi:MAG: caspase family protein [Nitrospirae bacterium]|nr:caspase family protein [Nitrospirota bacterium]
MTYGQPETPSQPSATASSPAAQLATNPSSPITSHHVATINDLFKKYNVRDGFVEIDRLGRIQLKGSYLNEEEVDKAFSLAQSTVGVKWVSPVDPENVVVPGWSKKLSEMMLKAAQSPAVKKSAGPPGPIKNRYALVVGIGRFQNERVAPQLEFAEKDASDLYKYLIDSAKGGFTKNNVALIIGEKATRANIKNAMDEIISKAQDDDLVVLYISSHGTKPDKEGYVFIVTHDTVFEKPGDKMWSTSISATELSGFFQGIRAKRVVAILDTCYSSGAYKNIKGLNPEGAKSLGVEDETYGISENQAKKMIGSKDIVLEESSSFSSDGWGKVLISASGNNERSFESKRLKNGFFTYFLLDGLKQTKGEIANAFSYAKPRVTDGVWAERNEHQHPQVVPDTKDWNIKLAKSK